MKDICDLQSPFWISEHAYTSVDKPDRLPASSQKRLLDLSQLRKRALEVRQLVVSDLIHIYLCHQERSQYYASTFLQYTSETEEDCFEAVVPEDLFRFVESHYQVLSQKRAGHIAMLLELYSSAQYKIKRVEDTISLLVKAYWNSDSTQLENELVKKARTCSLSSTMTSCPLALGTVMSSDQGDADAASVSGSSTPHEPNSGI